MYMYILLYIIIYYPPPRCCCAWPLFGHKRSTMEWGTAQPHRHMCPPYKSGNHAGKDRL